MAFGAAVVALHVLGPGILVGGSAVDMGPWVPWRVRGLLLSGRRWPWVGRAESSPMAKLSATWAGTCGCVIRFRGCTCSVEPHLRAETLLRGDLIFHEFIHKLTWPIMRQPHALRSLFITLHCVTLLRLNLV